MHEAYAQALFNESQGKSEVEQTKLAEKLLEVLKKKGHSRLLPRIVAAFERLTNASELKQTILTLSDAAHLGRFKSEIEKEEAKHFGSVSPTYTVVTDRTLIGGFVLQKKDTRVDASYKRHLLSLFSALTETSK